MTTSRLTTHRNTSSKKITNSPFSAGKSLAQKFGVKYIETSPGIISDKNITIHVVHMERMEALGNNREQLARKVGFSNALLR